MHLAVLFRAMGASLTLTPAATLPAQGPVAYVVAPGASASAEARRLLRICRWSDTSSVRDADILMVVVRSSGSAPMASLYDSLKWLREAASSQMNDTGAQFHIYLYTIRPDLTFLQTDHRSYDVHPEERIMPPGNAPPSPHPGLILYPCG